MMNSTPWCAFTKSMIGGRFADSQASPAAITFDDGQPESPCMSLQTLGVMKLYWATVP